MGRVTRAPWFGPAIDAVLGGADAIAAARGPRELEQAVAELIGGELYRVLYETGKNLWFSEWFGELIEAARKRADRRLLYGLASMALPEHAAACRKALGDEPAEPAWLDDLLNVTATGEVHQLRDTYGTRFGVIAEFSYGTHPFAYLLDIDGSESVQLAGAGVYDDVDHAVKAWFAEVGDSAGDMAPHLVKDAGDLNCVAQLSQSIFGDESRQVMDNWFRAQRRVQDLAEVLATRGMPLPAAEYLFDANITSMIAEFTAWYETRRGTQPDPGAVFDVAEQWTGGVLPETWYSVSPGRIATQLELISDWPRDDPMTIEVRSLLTDWVSWLSERANLPAHLRERVQTAVR
jgi:hypothetical protein